MKRNQLAVIFAVIATLLVLAFQNCGQISVAPVVQESLSSDCNDPHTLQGIADSAIGDELTFRALETVIGNSNVQESNRLFDWTIRVNEEVYAVENSSQASVPKQVGCMNIEVSARIPKCDGYESSYRSLQIGCPVESTTTTTTVSTTTTTVPNEPFNIPGQSGRPALGCSQEPIVTDPEPAVPPACANLIDGLREGKVNAPFPGMDVVTERGNRIGQMYANGVLTRNMAVTKIYTNDDSAITCDPLFRANGMGKNEYSSLRFVPSAGESGSFRLALQPQGNPPFHRNAAVLATISECPGDFGKINSASNTRELLFYSNTENKQFNTTRSAFVPANEFSVDRCVVNLYQVGLSGEVNWHTPTSSGDDSTRLGCRLIPGKTYYLNLVFREPRNMKPTCPAGFPIDSEILPLELTRTCGFRITPQKSL